jgi:branched-chain amino acid transport system ATP-binding protein
MSLLTASNVESGYGDIQIIDVDEFTTDEGEMVAIIGPNGAGKSTFLKTIAGILPLWSGTITYQGQELAGNDVEEIFREGLSYVPQDANVFSELTVRENLKIGGWTLDTGYEDRMEQIFELFPVLEERVEQRVGGMSGGEQQMVAIGMALMTEPELLMLDEPSAGLAPGLVDDMFQNVARINERGTAILIVEQNARAALAEADRGVVLDQGRIEFEGDSEAMLDSDEIAELYLGQNESEQDSE